MDREIVEILVNDEMIDLDEKLMVLQNELNTAYYKSGYYTGMSRYLEEVIEKLTKGENK